jgi:hypothetical protein
MRSVEIGLIDTTETVDTRTMAAAVAALNIQVSQHLRQHWGFAPDVTVRLLTKAEPIPREVWPIRLVDKLLQKEGGFHSTTADGPFAKVVVTRDSNDWTIVASHEALEMLVDPTGSRLQVAQAIKCAGGHIHDDEGHVEYLVEICDPCEANQFAYEIDGIMVSDFVTPQFYACQARPGERLSFNGTLAAPRQIGPGGYITWIHPRSSQIRQMIWLDPQGQPQTRVVGQAPDGNLRSFVDSETRHLAHTAAKWPFKFEIRPGEKTRPFKCEHDHWVTYHHDGVIEIELLGPGTKPSPHSEHIKAHAPIKRPAGTHHTVKNRGATLLQGDKDLIDPATLIR